MNYRVLIIGAGRIGAFFDSSSDHHILTHAHAFSRHAMFELVGFVDADFNRAVQAAQRWDVQAFASLEQAFMQSSIDVVCVATPDPTHYDILNQLVRYPVKLVFAEKPLTKTLEQAYKIKQLYAQVGIPVLVNYSRRFVPEFHEIRQRVQAGEFGRFVAGTGHYGKGLLHNGSHMLDFVRFLLGDITVVDCMQKIFDCYDDDPSIMGKVHVADYDAPFFLQPVDCNLFTIFEMDFLFEKRRVRIIDSGFFIEEYAVQPNTMFQGYSNLVLMNKYSSSLAQSLYCAADNIAHFLADQQPLRCTLDDAYTVMKLCTQDFDAKKNTLLRA
ncbi:Gfo/Idh/MocA family oxidoreductase [Candidatus Babeliales bacterium]|nr:Gfo/Idh/MocA family oxidoreductase [Candidatus Babeliales bacterium]